MAKRTTTAGSSPKRGAVRAARRQTKSGVDDLPVVAIGASAGGLDPIGRLLAGFATDCGLAFVVIQHLDPTSKSMLPELLGRQTGLSVRPAVDGQALSPNEVYVIPPGVYLTISDGRLHFAQAETGRGARMPIDLFLRSLAAERRERGIGIILSGAGEDGAEGLKALKDAGGLTLVQDPDEAQHDGMPRHAVAAARPDHVLKVQEIPAVVARYVAHHYVKPNVPAASDRTGGIGDQVSLKALVDYLKSATGKDFRLYKAGTMQRRTERRMALHGISAWTDYLRLLHTSPAETDALIDDLLINVTEFFRDPGAFEALAKPITTLLREQPADKPVRIWVAGCSSGEEAYSLAILLMEQMAVAGRRLSLQIFATDVDDDALATARAGAYPESIRDRVSSERLEHFFVRENGGFRVSKALRESVIFSHHDLLRDPPFSRLDLVSCRNLLIYLLPEAQRSVLATLHFALKDGGLLLLGSAEATNSGPGLFEAVDEKQRIYRRRNRDRAMGVRFSMLEGGRGLDRASQIGLTETPASSTLPAIVQRMLLQAYSPAAVVTNRHFAPIYFSGAVDRYLQIVPGEPNQDLLAIAREGLRAKLRETIARAFRARRRVRAHGVWLNRGGKAMAVMIEAERVGEDHDDLILVTFVDELPAAPPGPRTAANKGGDGAEMPRLRQQLTDMRRELNRTIQELRETNKELKAKNEEAMSLNEEFLSTNEELESSKEELQSLNEELTTVNNQLRQAFEQQQRMSTDLSNLLDSSSVATILLDENLKIKVFNPKMEALFALLDADIGRPLADLVPKFADPQLLVDTARVLKTGAPSEREIHAETGAWYLRSVLPYLSEAGKTEGAVVTFADVSQLKEAELASQAARRYAETIIDTVNEPLMVLDAQSRAVSANKAFCTALDISMSHVTGRALHEFGHPALSDARLQALIERQVSDTAEFGSIELDTDQADGGHRSWKVNVRRFRVSSGAAPLLLLTMRDVTDERHIVRRQLQLLIDAMPGAVLAVDDQGRIRFANKETEVLLGYRTDELIGAPFEKLVPPEVRIQHAVQHAGYMGAPTSRPMGTSMEIHGIASDGERIPLDIGLSPVTTSEGRLVMLAIHDLRGRKEGETRLRAAKAEADRANESKSRFLAAASHDLRQPLQIISLVQGVLDRRVSDPDARKSLERLDYAVSYMTELLDSLLDVHRIESGALQVQLAEHPVTTLLNHAIEGVAPIAAAKGLKLRVVRSSAVVRSDRRLLARILGNLLSNAVKYTDRGRVLLGCRRRGNTLRIEVWDTGMGIPPESLEAIFEEFYQVDRSGAGKPGLGLGLYIVRRFAEALGYTVEIQSKPGKATMFAVVIPDPQFAKPTQGVAEAAEATSALGPTVLLVEDDPAQLDTLRALLEMEGYQVVAGAKGSEALAHLEPPASFRPDIIVSDYNLPGGLNGLEVIRKVRARLNTRTPAMIVTGRPLADDRRAMDGDGIRILPKPVKPSELMATASALMEAVRPGWRPSRRPISAPVPSPSPDSTRAEIAIIDDDPAVLDAVRMTLDADGYAVETFQSAEALLSDPNRSRFRCLVADMSLPGIDGVELQKRLKAEDWSPPIIFLTASGDLTMALTAMREGAADFLQKPVGKAALSDSVSRVVRQGEQSDRDQTERNEVALRLHSLTKREREVLEHILAGQPNKNIAADLGISQRTTEHHRRAVMAKMGFKSLAALVRAVGTVDR